MTRRTKNIVLVVLVAAMINLPLLHSMWQNHRIDSSGTQVRAQVTDNRAVDDQYFIEFTIPAEGERDEVTGIVRVEKDAYDQAVTTGEIEVRQLRDNPSIYNVEGEVTTRVGLVITLLADLFLAIMVLLLVRFGPKLRPVLVLLATEDLERCPPGSVLDRIEGDLYVVCGEVTAIEDDEIMLDLGDRRVKVVLDGHQNPAGYEQPVRATGRMIA
jgi:hypothetical protein